MRYSLADISDHGDQFYTRELMYLCPSKKERAQRFRNISDRKLCILGDYIARCLVAEFLGIDPCDVLIEPDTGGRPTITVPAGSGLFCSISHSGDIACACVSESPVGIDIEQIGPYDRAVAEAVFGREELAYLNENGDEGFYRIWTAKESYLKCIGTGLAGTCELQKINAFCLPEGYICETVRSKSGYVISISRKS